MKPPLDVLRADVRRSVATRDAIDDDERRCIAEFLEHFDRLVAPFDEHADPVHVTGSAIVVGPRGVLLLKHRRLGLWLQPGGHIDEHETPWAAALREAAEETGLDVDFVERPPRLVHVDVHPGGRGHTHLDLRYLVDGGDADPMPPEGESQDIEWLDWDAAIERASDDRLKSALRSLRPRDGYRSGAMAIDRERIDEQRKDEEDLEREHQELFHELRSIIPGAEVLFAFLLTVAFTNRFEQLTDFQRHVYFVTFVLSAVTLVLLLAPTAFHRVRFRQRDKEAMLRVANVEAIAAMLLMSLSISCVVLLITDLMFDTTLAWTLAIVAWLVASIVWWAYPVARRLTH
jgi:8-oxo-dGTP pyrophosphatase MutT (NUDIX family)